MLILVGNRFKLVVVLFTFESIVKLAKVFNKQTHNRVENVQNVANGAFCCYVGTDRSLLDIRRFCIHNRDAPDSLSESF